MNYIMLLEHDLSNKRIDEDWGSFMWLASQEIGNSQELSIGKVIIKSRKSNPRHSHPNCEEVLYLMSGSLEHTIADEKISVLPGDVLTIPPGVFHNVTNIGDGDAHMIVAYSEGKREFELEK